MNVLYIDGVGPFGGASRSLYETLSILTREDINAYFLTVRGTALSVYSEIATDTVIARGITRFDNTEYSHYRGLRWLIILREIYHLPYSVLSLFVAARRWKHKIDLIHLNEITEIIPGLIAKWLFNAPIIVHVRSPQWHNAHALRSRLLFWVLRNLVDGVIAIDETTRATLPVKLIVDVIHNSFSPGRVRKPDTVLREKLAALRHDALKVGFVGNLHISKGILDLVEAARLSRMDRVDVEYVVIGGDARKSGGIKGCILGIFGLAQDVRTELLKRIGREDLGSTMHVLGATRDIQAVYEVLDVIAFPSHLDAPGRPIFEAAFFGVPCITCVSKPMADTLVNGETGIIVPAKSPAALAAVVQYFEANRHEVARMGAQARQLAETNFEPRKNAAELRRVYLRVLGRTEIRDDHY